MKTRAAVAMTLALLWASAAFAQEAQRYRPVLFLNPPHAGAPPAGRPRCIADTPCRAGFPHELACRLQPTETRGGLGYYVGGGTGYGHGEPRRRDEGTWGWDETGRRHLRLGMILGWSHGRRRQGGTGAYRVDGHPLPDIFYAASSTANRLTRGSESEE